MREPDQPCLVEVAFPLRLGRLRRTVLPRGKGGALGRAGGDLRSAGEQCSERAISAGKDRPGRSLGGFFAARLENSSFERRTGFSRLTDCADRALSRRGEVLGLQLLPAAQCEVSPQPIEFSFAIKPKTYVKFACRAICQLDKARAY